MEGPRHVSNFNQALESQKIRLNPKWLWVDSAFDGFFSPLVVFLLCFVWTRLYLQMSKGASHKFTLCHQTQLILYISDPFLPLPYKSVTDAYCWVESRYTHAHCCALYATCTSFYSCHRPKLWVGSKRTAGNCFLCTKWCRFSCAVALKAYLVTHSVPCVSFESRCMALLHWVHTWVDDPYVNHFLLLVWFGCGQTKRPSTSSPYEIIFVWLQSVSIWDAP